MAQKVETLTANQRKTIQLHLKEYRQIINTSDIADKIYLHRHLQECTNRFEQKFKSLPNFENIDWASLEQILVDDRYNDFHNILKTLDGKDIRWIKFGEYIQISGRAGRRGNDDSGFVIQMFDEKVEPEIAKNMPYGVSDPLFSSYHVD